MPTERPHGAGFVSRWQPAQLMADAQGAGQRFGHRAQLVAVGIGHRLEGVLGDLHRRIVSRDAHFRCGSGWRLVLPLEGPTFDVSAANRVTRDRHVLTRCVNPRLWDLRIYGRGKDLEEGRPSATQGTGDRSPRWNREVMRGGLKQHATWRRSPCNRGITPSTPSPPHVPHHVRSPCDGTGNQQDCGKPSVFLKLSETQETADHDSDGPVSAGEQSDLRVHALCHIDPSQARPVGTEETSILPGPSTWEYKPCLCQVSQLRCVVQESM